ncbi:MAG: flagellar biosynthesis protein FlhA [Polyangiaceae bacterium]
MTPRSLVGTGATKAPVGGAEFVLASFVALVVGLMIVPLPTPLLDVLIATNLSASIVILLVVLYVPDALSIATFPTLLLLTTLFRLALNVSSTRLILLQADAGEVIRAFGTFVVRGNYVVGAIVFTILTVIQFVVIAKGSERVAEVGARFVLDAMPGKQMAIDSELRSGAIDGDEARRRRRALSRESQFYGAMDGAMKFVKGDVIAGIVITIVNVVGGLAIGVGQRGLEATTALQRYGVLTIGDGLVSQIPALVLSTAAGILVTRTASEDDATPLGRELARQLFSTPKALTVAGTFVTALAIVPGLPFAPFALLGAALILVGERGRRNVLRRAEANRLGIGAGNDPRPATHAAVPRASEFVPTVVPLALALPREDEALRASAFDTLLAVRTRVFAHLGVPLPEARIFVDADLDPGRCELRLHELPAGTFDLTVGDPSALGDALFVALRRRAAEFVGLSETQRLLDALDKSSPATVRNVVPKPVPLPVFTDVLRRLVEEGTSIRDLRAILEALALVATTERDPLQLAEFVRSQLRRAITHGFTAGRLELDVVLVDPILEDTVRRAITRTPNGAFLTLAPAIARDVVVCIQKAVHDARAESAAKNAPGSPVLLTHPDVRRFVRKLVETDLPDLAVVSFAELLPEIALRPLAKASPVGGP